MSATPLPVTGAWRSGDPTGDRPVHTLRDRAPVRGRATAMLRDVTVAYETWGTLNADASNAVLVCHAWTGDSHAAGRSKPGHPAPGWWDDIIGPSEVHRHRPLVRRNTGVLGELPRVDRPPPQHPTTACPTDPASRW
ncbi:MAG: hypothetical protein R2697_10875 [Ilumatobacteraceae bacterium]